MQEELLKVKLSLCESLPIVSKGKVGDKHCTFERIGDCGPAALYYQMERPFVMSCVKQRYRQVYKT